MTTTAQLQLFALLVAALAPLVAPQSGTPSSCHADLLIKGINFAAIDPQVQQAVGKAVAEKIALETGDKSDDVMAKILAGNYNAPWSPSAGRPPADIFLASLLRQCGSPEMVLGVFRGPQLQSAVVGALKTSLASTNAVSGEITVIGASVVPEKTPAPAPGGAPAPAPGLPIPQPPANQGSASLPGLPAAGSSPPELITDASEPSSSSSGPSQGLLFVGIGVLLLAAIGIPLVISKMKQQDDDDEERCGFTNKPYVFDGH